MQASKLIGAVAPCVIALFLATPANAAEPAQTSAGEVENILVTSRRAEESIQDVPVSVSAFTEQDLERISPNTLVDMNGLIPNVSIAQQTAGPGMGAIFIRGIGSADVEKTTPPQVGLVIDGIFQGTNTGQIVDMFDIDQVEVNRGPQGVLYGKNTTGGTIVVRRSQPVLNELKYKVSATAGSDGEAIYKGRVSIPLIEDQLALKLGAMSSERDGLYENTTRNFDDAEVDYTTYTASLKWKPIEELTAVVWYDNIDDQGNFGIPNDPYVDGNTPFKTQADLPQSVDYQVDTWGLNLQWDVGGATLESITGYVDSQDTVQQDFDNSTLATLAIPGPQLHTLRDQQFTQTSQELRLSGDLTDQIAYTVGGFYWNSELDFAQGTNNVFQFPSVVFGLPPGVPCLAAGLSPNPIVGDAVCQTPPSGAWQETNEETDAMAVFGSVRYQLTDRLELSAGLRYLDEEIDFETSFWTGRIPNAIEPARGPASPTPFPGFPIKSNNDWTKTIGEATATYQLTDANMVYARYSQGYRSGGFSNRGTDPQFLSFSPETADAYEIGSKNEFFDRKLQLNLTVFYTLIQDGQFNSVLTTAASPGTNTIINNAGGDAETQGFELQSAWLINDQFSILATYGYLDTSSDSFLISSQRVPFTAAGAACTPTPTAPCLPVLIGGNDLGSAPKYNYSVSGVYSQDFGPYNVSFNVTAHGQDDIIILGGATSAAVVTQEAYDLYDARAAVQWTMDNGNTLGLSLVGKNLSDEEYLWSALPLGTGGFQGWALPRTYAVELIYQH